MAKRNWFLSLLLILALSNTQSFGDTTISSNTYRRDTVGSNEISELDQDGDLEIQGDFASDLLMGSEGVKIGNDQTTPTIPTTTTGVNFGVKIPYTNATGSTIAAGAVVIASATLSGTSSVLVPGAAAAILATTTVLGINPVSLSAGATGYLTVAGYALCLTTGTVNIGDILVSTAGSAGAGAAGYAGRTTGTQVVGTMVGKAMSQGTASGGLTLIKVGD